MPAFAPMDMVPGAGEDVEEGLEDEVLLASELVDLVGDVVPAELPVAEGVDDGAAEVVEAVFDTAVAESEAAEMLLDEGDGDGISEVIGALVTGGGGLEEVGVAAAAGVETAVAHNAVAKFVTEATRSAAHACTAQSWIPNWKSGLEHKHAVPPGSHPILDGSSSKELTQV